MENLSLYIILKRKEANFSQEEFSVKLGICRSLVSAYETGKKKPPVRVLAKMEKVLKCSFKDFNASHTASGEANSIRLMRKQYGYSQIELADKLGCSQALVALWESGRKQPSPEQLIRIAKVLKCKTEDLI